MAFSPALFTVYSVRREHRDFLVVFWRVACENSVYLIVDLGINHLVDGACLDLHVLQQNLALDHRIVNFVALR